MRIARLMAMVAVLTILVAPSPSDAKAKIKTLKQAQRYDFSAGVVHSHRSDPTCAASCSIAKDKTIDIGGVTFVPLGGGKRVARVLVTARDDNNPFGQVRLGACQDTNGNGTCGESAANEPAIDGCVAPGKSIALSGASRSIPISVFVYSAWGCPKYMVPDVIDSQGGGTSGTVTITYPSS